ncbi:MAG: NnrS family protein [Halopseudomonas yangmingensis]
MLSWMQQRLEVISGCAFRSFFLLSAAAAVLLIGLWLGFLHSGRGIAFGVAGPFAWHLHEMLWGLSLAALIGFLLTALPEFVKASEPPRRLIVLLALLWLAGRLAALAAGLLGYWPLLLLHWALLLLLCRWVLPPLWRDPRRRHRGFLWGLLLLCVLRLGLDQALLRGAPAMPWLHATLHLFMLLILLAHGRISLRIVNRHLDALQITERRFLPRPPLRHLATSLIALYALVQLLASLVPGLLSPALQGWLALAAAAALLNLLNDWRIGRELWQPHVTLLFALPLCMAVGYGLLGFAQLGAGIALSAGWHWLGIAALGLSLLVVMSIAGRLHSGLDLDRRAWLPVAGLLLLGSVLARSLSTLGHDWLFWISLSACAWMLAFACWAVWLWPVLTRLRPGQQGC